MSLRRRILTMEFKQQVVGEFEAGKPLAEAAREHQVHPNCIGLWKPNLEQYGDKAFAGNGVSYTDDAKIAELERIIGQQAVEIAFLKRVLKQLEQNRASETSRGGGK